MEAHSADAVLTLQPPEQAEPAGGSLVVAVEATRLAREVRGIGRYVRALLPRLVALRPGLQLILFVKRQADIEALQPGFDAIPVMRGRIQFRLAKDMHRTAADVHWYPWNTVAKVPARGAVVATVHDIVPIAHPDPRLRGWQKNLRWRRRYAATAKRSTLIIADSRFTADEIHRMLGVPYDRMRVVLLSADDFRIPPAEGDAATLARLGVTQPFVLAVGAADRRKNLATLDQAMARVVEAHPELRLVLAGPRRDGNSAGDSPAWRQTLGFVSDDELAALYRGAEVLVMPSTYEGFGLPVLEAMRLGTPVICAQASSLPEVGGNAALWVAPTSVDALANAIERVVCDEQLRMRLSAASVAQSARFSWDSTARQTIEVFEEAVVTASWR